MKAWIAAYLTKVIAAAATLTGKKFGLLVASSLVATSGIVAAGMTSGHELGPLASLVGRSLAAEPRPLAAVAEPEAATELAPEAEATPEAPVELPEESAPIIESSPLEEAAPGPEPEPEEEAPPPPAEETKPEAGRIKHVFVVSLASPGYDAAFGATPTMPYLATTLRPQGDLLTNFKLLDPASLPNSFAAVSGQAPSAASKENCPSYEACVFPVETLSFADQLGTAQFSWHAYMEGMADPEGKPDNCVHPEPGATEAPTPGAYSSTLNPFAYFHSLLDLGACSESDVPLTELDKDLGKTEKTANFNWISPTPCNAGIPGTCAPGSPEGAAAADAWLATVVPKILKSPAYKADGLLVVTFGSANPVPNIDPALPPTPATDLKTGTLLVSKFLTAGATDAAPYEPYALLRTDEELFGLGQLGEAGGAKVRTLAPVLLGENSGD
jgi:hypothetical protein